MATVAAVRAVEPVNERCLGLRCDATDAFTPFLGPPTDTRSGDGRTGSDRRRIFGGGDRADADSPAWGSATWRRTLNLTVTRKR
jgi:hypothetical protein